jgi:hypothetical protein
MHVMAVLEGWERKAPFLVVAAGSVGDIIVDCAGGIDRGLGLKPCNESCEVLIRDARGANEDVAFPEEAGETARPAVLKERWVLSAKAMEDKYWTRRSTAARPMGTGSCIAVHHRREEEGEPFCEWRQHT